MHDGCQSEHFRFWLVVLGCNATLTATVIMAVGDAYVFPGFLTPILKQPFFPKPPTTFLTCFCRDERRNYTGKKSRLNRGSNSQPPGHESDMLTTEPTRWGHFRGAKVLADALVLNVVYLCIKFEVPIFFFP